MCQHVRALIETAKICSLNSGHAMVQKPSGRWYYLNSYQIFILVKHVRDGPIWSIDTPRPMPFIMVCICARNYRKGVNLLELDFWTAKCPRSSLACGCMRLRVFHFFGCVLMHLLPHDISDSYMKTRVFMQAHMNQPLRIMCLLCAV